MTTLSHDRLSRFWNDEAKTVRTAWGWFLALGIVQIVVGSLAVAFAISATLASMIVLGAVLLVAAGAQIAAAIFARGWGGFFAMLLMGILYAVAGVLTLQHPLMAAEGLTLLLAAMLLVGGVFRIIVAVAERFPSWGWVLGNGLLSVLLGVLIWQQWPWSGLWVLGMFVGIDLMLNGVTWTMLAVAARSAVSFVSER